MPAAASPIRVVYVLPEPTPYRTPLLDRLVLRHELTLAVVYSAASVQGRTWTVEPRHPHVVLGGRRLPGARRLLHHDYPVDLRIRRLLDEARPQCVVASGWSTFAAQASEIWALAHRVPYLVGMESHAQEQRRGWRRALRRAAVSPLLRHADGVLAAGSLAAEHAVTLGARPGGVTVFANTIDVDAFARRVDALRERRDELRAGFGIRAGEVAVLTAARLVPEKGLDVLVGAMPADGARLLVAGDGPLRAELHDRAAGRPVELLGNLDSGRLAEAYAAADVFALVSRREPWGVVVNEAAAAGLPLVLSNRVGAAYDLLVPHETGELVPVDDVEATAAALMRLVRDEQLRRGYGTRAREVVAAWGYEPMVERFVAAVQAAASRHQP